ncbi:unannotated protein [freshwater metagenome]|uniref:Unannotated protein n=1 Tax=freshwater metagenome TaxID=449393 RepID=A0A6J6J5F8_9ZZZZ|nr:hypothetical protein [Actinomycetota bacterium]
MSESYKPHRPSLKRLLNQVGSRYALSNQLLLLFLIPAFGTGLVFDSLRLETTFLERFLVATVGYLVTISPLIVARIVLTGKLEKSRPLLIASLFLLAGFIRGITLLNVEMITGQHQPGEEFFRLLGGPIFTFTSLTVLAVLVSNYQRHRESLAALADERYRLQIRSAGIKTKVKIQREELLSKVSSLLDPAIAKIQAKLTGKSSTEAIESLRSTVEDVVRPLSVEVAEANDEIEAESGRAVIAEKAPMPRRIMLGEFLLPLWAAIICSVAIVPGAFLLEDPLDSIVIVLFAFLCVVSGIGMIQKLTFKLPIHPVLAATIIPALYAASLTPIYIIAVALNWRVSTEQIGAFLIYAAVVGGAIFAAQFAQLQRKTTTESMAAVNQQLEILNAALRQELWLNRRRTAAVLHGPVQAALFASAMRLSQTTVPTPELIEEVSQDIQASLEKLNSPSNLQGETISSLLGQVVEIWSDVATISVEISEQLEPEIAGQPLASEALIEISREFITNAIKHGKATDASLKVSRLDKFRLIVELVDDGQGVPPGAKPGFGSKLLSELSISWRQDRIVDKTVSYAEIVLSHEN